ncbi:MAG: hypothetical protein ACI9TH_000149 [Kiritimatiellia bacterium]
MTTSFIRILNLLRPIQGLHGIGFSEVMCGTAERGIEVACSQLSVEPSQGLLRIKAHPVSHGGTQGLIPEFGVRNLCDERGRLVRSP